MLKGWTQTVSKPEPDSSFNPSLAFELLQLGLICSSE